MDYRINFIFLDVLICVDLHFESSALIYILVNGNWGTWSEYGECSKTCNSGEKTRTRQCDNPPVAHGGLDCTGSNSEKTTCNADACPGNKTKNTQLCKKYGLTNRKVINSFIIKT